MSINRKATLVGGGIGNLAAAAFMIRDGGVEGRDITVLDALPVMGGSLDAGGDAVRGYSLRGGRMLTTDNYECTWDLFKTIPSLTAPGRTVFEETLAFNERHHSHALARLVDRRVAKVGVPSMGFSMQDRFELLKLSSSDESALGSSRITDCLSPTFFETEFWLMWATTFAFQPWHSAVEFKRYLVRFAHMVDGFGRLQGIMRTVYNQYDSMVRPLQKWLEARGVKVELNTRVTDLGFHERDGEIRVTGIAFNRSGRDGEIMIGAEDLVLVTLGSMTEASSLGAMDKVPRLLGKSNGGAWALWETLAAGRPAFGRPEAFANHIGESKWISFTTTMHDSAFLRIVNDLTGNVPGEGGLITFPDSGWLASIVIPHQPHFIDQPDGVSVLWGYGLSIDKPGDFVKKPMSACTGAEIMTEVMGHLRIKAEAATILQTSICIPCMMPFITSQFLRRKEGDRPQVAPKGSQNLAFIGQFCELPDDVVFTVEYSIRSAQTAVYALLGLKLELPAVYQGKFDPRVLYRAFRALHDVRS